MDRTSSRVESTRKEVGLAASEKSDYWVPARWLGTRVTVDAGDSVIVIRAKDLIIAEHPVATGPGQRIEAPAHVRERWARSVPNLVARPPKGCHVTFTENVQVRPLSVYAEVAS